MTSNAASQTSEQLTTTLPLHIDLTANSPLNSPTAEIDPRLIETVDYVDPAKHARILALACSEDK